MGCHGRVIQALSSSGVANPDDDSVQGEILKRHPQGSVLWDCELSDSSSAITVTESTVLTALKAFLKDSSPGVFQLRAQHILDAVSGFIAPIAQDCLYQLII